MKTKMTHAMRMELANAVRDRYAAAANKDKRRILEKFIAVTAYHEKSATDRVCGKRLKALLPILMPALERNRHLNSRRRYAAKTCQ
ncbi:hypothetical protein [Mesorhizobium dulcispinae]|uniref:hypothetical protein n=1 Tax=Mesorhizobium dulcispinae TaxID=3072316 RepID=UPI002A2403F0|nr:hypothetical protein [Mesorhizobium sp. VK23D]MDX8522732.1 hypothetical protein [Mesorhizobium sp. VK23D]